MTTYKEENQIRFRLDIYFMAAVLEAASYSRGGFSLCLAGSARRVMVPGGNTFHLEPGTISESINVASAKVPQVMTPPPTHTRQHSVLHPMRCPTTVQPEALLPRVFIHKPNTSPSAPKIPSNKEHYDPIAQQTRSKVPHTVELPPPRVDKATDLGPISRRMRSQTTATANVITPAQASKQQYPAQFHQSLAMPVLDKTSRKSLK